VPAVCTISVDVNDDLVVNGAVIGAGEYTCDLSAFGLGNPSGCNCSHSITYTLDADAGASVTIAVQNNYDPGWSIDGTICFTPISSPPP
jgi:hypothetical protein